MNVVIGNIHKEVDKNLRDQYLAMKAFQVPDIPKEYRYFAADIIAGQYKGKYVSGLACACQSFMNSRLVHMDSSEMTSERVLIGDYFAGQILGFELPDNRFEILDKFASFVEDEVCETEEAQAVDLKKFEKLFREVAEVANE